MKSVTFGRRADVPAPATYNWRDLSACTEEEPDLFFPIGTTGPAVFQVEQAKAVCRRCPVTAICLDWALQHGEDEGVWGGTSEDERRAMKRRAARKRPRRSS
ncbi:WhiB family transcriptional regulator [Streptomyces sp. NPDC049597]|uniref:WhiB family transcriptional regulator n=1 Tax=Streptomyces sp. NPDC049597 TaxID=3155276 RepID=UPI003429D666